MKLFLIAKSNMKKKKSNLIILLVLIAIATMLLYSGMNVMSKMDSFMGEINESQNGAHVQYAASLGYREEISKVITGQEEVESYTTNEILLSSVSYQLFNPERDDEEESMSFLMANYDEFDGMSQIKIYDKAKEWTEDSIVVPMYMKVSKGYQTGDIIELKNGAATHQFRIYGFQQDIMYATISNLSIYRCYVPSATYLSLKETDPAFIAYDEYNIRIQDAKNSEQVESEMTKQIKSSIVDPKFKLLIGIDFVTMSNGASMFVDIMMSIMALFAFFIIIISLIVIRFSINTSIETNLANVGILEAVGYTTSQLAWAAVIEYAIVTSVGVILGLVMAIAGSSIIAAIVSSSIGLLWKTRFDLTITIISVCLILAVTLFVTYLSTRKYHKITPLDALREGVKTHHFRKNHFALSKTKLNLNSALGLKSMFHNHVQNISIMLIVGLLCFTCTICLSLYYNFVIEDQAMVTLVGIEKPEILVSINELDGYEAVDITQIQEEINNDPDVNNVLRNGVSGTIVKNGEKELNVAVNVYSNPEELTVNTLIEGRRPKHKNEINVSYKIINELGASLGDSILLNINNQDHPFVIVGITQHINNMGYVVVITEEGRKDFDQDYNCDQLYVYLKPNVDIDQKVETIGSMYEEEGQIQVCNFSTIYKTVMGSFSGSLSSICTLFVGITFFVIALIIFLVVKMKLVQERRYMGIYKALGYTTSQIIWQTAIQFAPVVSLGGLVGVILGKLGMNKVTQIALSFAGIKSANMLVPLSMLAGIFIVIVISSFAFTVLSARKIRKIEPYKMIIEM